MLKVSQLPHGHRIVTPFAFRLAAVPLNVFKSTRLLDLDKEGV
jgi:hypothetical protein